MAVHKYLIPIAVQPIVSIVNNIPANLVNGLFQSYILWRIDSWGNCCIHYKTMIKITCSTVIQLYNYTEQLYDYTREELCNSSEQTT